MYKMKHSLICLQELIAPDGTTDVPLLPPDNANTTNDHNKIYEAC